MPKRRARSMSTGGRDDEAAGLSPGGIMPYAIASWPTPAARVVFGGDGQPRRTHHQLRRAIASRARSRHWTTLHRTMAEWCWPPPVSAEVGTDAEVLQVYQDQNTIVEPGLRWIKNPAAISPAWLEKPAQIAALAMLTDSAYSSTALSRDRFACTCARMNSSSLGTKVRQRHPQRWWYGPYLPK